MSKSIKITCPYCDSKKISIWCLFGMFDGDEGYSVKCDDCGGHFDLVVKKYKRFKELTPEQLDHLWKDEVVNDD